MLDSIAQLDFVREYPRVSPDNRWSYQWWKGIPREKGNHKAKPGEEVYASIFVDRVQHGNSSSFAVDWVDFRRRP
jgi:hypothetical protein